MKKLKKKKVLLFAAAVILVCSAVLATAVHVAFGAEGSKVATDGNVIATAPPSTADIPLAEPGAQYIAKEEATVAFKGIVSRIFGQTANDSAMIAKFGEEPYAYWYIEDGAFGCFIDALSGEVLSCERMSEYSGDRITQREYDENIHDTLRPETGDGAADMYNSPGNVYIKAALKIVSNSLAEGRVIENAELNAAQFMWEASAQTGTIEADVDVLMETGRCYRLSFWGTDPLVLAGYFSYPTQHACLWGYYYEEDAPEFSDEWQTAPGITPGPAATTTAAPAR